MGKKTLKSGAPQTGEPVKGFFHSKRFRRHSLRSCLTNAATFYRPFESISGTASANPHLSHYYQGSRNWPARQREAEESADENALGKPGSGRGKKRWVRRTGLQLMHRRGGTVSLSG